MKKLLSPLALGISVIVAGQANALQAISDHEMSKIDGQAFITIDTTEYSGGSGKWAGNYEFARINLGLDIETVVNADELRVGEFYRDVDTNTGVVPGTDLNGNPLGGANNPQALAADIIINSFALGRIENYDTAASATVDPFKITDPYIELAYKIENDVRKVVGVRFGFAEAQGYLSGDILSLSGKFEGAIRGPASIIYDSNCGDGATGNTSGFNCLLLNAAGDNEIFSSIDLVDGAVGTTGYGYGAGVELDDATTGDVSNPDNPYLNVQYLKRASWAGVPTGRRFQADPGVLALGLISLDSVLALVAVADECQVTGTPGCFSLTNYQSIYVGEAPSETDPNGQTASGVFVSLQTSEVPWSDLSGLGGSNRVLTERGAYLNSTQFKDSNGVIRYPLTLDFVDATSGTQRVATCVGRLKGC